MSEDLSTTGPTRRTFWGRLGHLLSGEVRSRKELLHELREAAAKELISRDTLAMLEGALEVSDLRVSDAMIPRAQMATLGADTDLPTILAAVVDSGHSRFPVHGDDKDEILGILMAKDLLHFFGKTTPPDIRTLLRPAALIPESMHLNVLLSEFKLTHNHMAIVVDEYGGISGLITIEDVLEEIVGEIDDEHDEDDEVPRIQPQADGTTLVDALTDIEDFNEHFGSRLPENEFDTIGGLVTAEIGHLLEPGETATLGRHTFLVTAADERRVLQFRVTSAHAD